VAMKMAKDIEAKFKEIQERQQKNEEEKRE
jgi:hypothetical protein